MEKIKYPPQHEVFCTKKCFLKCERGKLVCDCGEGPCEWVWAKNRLAGNNIQLSQDKRDVTFHPTYSAGTAFVLGDTPMIKNRHYYWELKVMAPLYGTDVMVGVTADDETFNAWQHRFTSMLGLNEQSWGYSYHGKIQHNRCVRNYGKKFGIGSLVGVHLDMYRGLLEYYVNRQSMGIAHIGIECKELYPVVSSTAAHSCLRVNCAISSENNLEIMCLESIVSHPLVYNKYEQLTNFVNLMSDKYLWLRPRAGKLNCKQGEGCCLKSKAKRKCTPMYDGHCINEQLKRACMNHQEETDLIVEKVPVKKLARTCLQQLIAKVKNASKDLVSDENTEPEENSIRCSCASQMAKTVTPEASKTACDLVLEKASAPTKEPLALSSKHFAVAGNNTVDEMTGEEERSSSKSNSESTEADSVPCTSRQAILNEATSATAGKTSEQ